MSEQKMRQAEDDPGGRAELSWIGLLTREELAGVLRVSLSTVERMQANEEITPVRVRGRVRFYLPHVLLQLAASALTRKNGRKADGEKLKAEIGEPPRGRIPETRYPRRAE